MKKRVEEKLKEKSRHISIVEGSSYSLMEGFGLRYLTPYALALGMSNFLIGVMSALPGLAGSLSELKGSRIINKYSRKKIVMSGTIFQALAWLPIIAVGYAYFFLGLPVIYSSVLLILFYTLLVISGAFISPAWNSWMKDLINKNTTSYFGKRGRVVGLVALVSSLVAGFILNYFQDKELFFGFAIIFVVAFVGRAACIHFFKEQYEPKMRVSEHSYFSFSDFVKNMAFNNFGKFTIFTALMSFAVAIASPFFSVYMLKDLNLGYAIFTLAIAVPSAIALAFLPLWGKFGDKYGNMKAIKLCGSLIFTVPLLWLFIPLLSQKLSHVLIYLFAVEIFSGIVWAGFNLSTATFVFDSVSVEKMPLYVAYTTILNSFGAFLGALLGGYLSNSGIVFFGLSSIPLVFAISSATRFILFFFISGKLKEVRNVEKLEMSEFKEFLIKTGSRQMLKSGVRRTGHTLH